MVNNVESKNIDQLLAEADELVRQISSDAVSDMQEEHRLQVQKHAQNLERIKAEVRGGTAKKRTLKKDSGAEGVHEAILDIVKAMRDYKNKIF